MHRPSAFNTGNHTTSQSSETHLKRIRLYALSHLNHLHPMHHACVPWRLVMTAYMMEGTSDASMSLLQETPLYDYTLDTSFLQRYLYLTSSCSVKCFLCTFICALLARKADIIVGELFTRWSEDARAMLMSSEVEAHRQPFHPHIKKGHVTNLTATLNTDHGLNLCKVDWGLPLEMSALGEPGPLAIARSLIPCAYRPDILRSHT